MLAPLLARWSGRNVAWATGITALAVWGSDLVALAIKTLVERPRPFEVLPQAEPLIGSTVGASMPSGHATTSFAGAVILTFLTRRAAPALFLLAVAIAFSRVYVGVHYPSDVLAGAALGSAFALAVMLALRSPRMPSGVPPRSEAPPPPG